MPKRLTLSSSAIGVLCIIFATLCFAFQGIIIKELLALHVTIDAMLFWRQVAFFPPYILYLFFLKRDALRWVGTKDMGAVMLIGILGFFCIPITNFTTLHKLEAGIERILIYSYPIFVVLFEALWKRRLPSRRFILAFFIIQLGIFLLVGGGDAMGHLMENIGPAAQVLFAAVLFGLYTLLIRPFAQKLGSHCYFLYGITGSFILITINYIIAEPFAIPATPAIPYLVLMMLISFPPSIFFAEGVRRIGGPRASFISTLGPIVTIFAAQHILGEHLSFDQLLGGAIVLLTLMMLEAETLKQIAKFWLQKTQKLP